MSGILPVLKAWGAAAERLAAYLPEAAALLHGSWLAALAVALAGAALLVVGVRLGRVLAAAGGGLIGWAAAGLLSGGGLPVPAGAASWVAACVVAAGCALAPALYPVALGAVPGAVLGLQVPVLGRAWAGAALGAAGLALLLLLVRRVVLAATAAAAGTVLLAIALLAAAARLPPLRVVAERPMLLLALAAVLVVAGTAFQLDSARAGARAPGRPDDRA